MKTMTIIKYEWKDLLRGKWIIGYGLIYLLLTDALLRFGGSGAKALLSLSNMMLLFIPLISMIYGVLYLYQSREFTELLLAQPLARNKLFWGLYGGLAAPLMAAFVLGVLIPLGYHGVLFTGGAVSSLMVVGLGAVLTMIFIGLGFVFALKFFDEKIKGLGLALLLWLFLSVLYDGFILLMVYLLGDYPIEQPILIVSLLNPIDLARIIVMLEFDISAMMGYTGAVFQRFFGSMLGLTAASGFLALWLGIPLWRGSRLFKKMDF